MRYPVSEGTQDDFDAYWYIASGFGEDRGTYYHSGSDINLKTGGNSDFGEPLYAICKAEVCGVDTGSTTGFGRQIFLAFKDPLGTKTYYAMYAHCQTVEVKVGDMVEQGQRIGTLGKSGTTISHLHFSIKNKANGMDNVPNTKTELKEWENPMTFIKKRLSCEDLTPMKDKEITYDDAEGHRHTVGWYVDEWWVEKKDNEDLEFEVDELETEIKKLLVRNKTLYTDLSNSLADGKTINGKYEEVSNRLVSITKQFNLNEIELKEVRDKLSHYLSQATVIDGIAIIIDALFKGRFRK